MRIILATGQEKIDEAIIKLNKYEVLISIEYKNELEKVCEEYRPEVILVTEGLTGKENLVEQLLKLKQKFNDIRIIYLVGNINYSNIDKINNLGMLVMTGIFDIVEGQKMNLETLINIIDKPYREEDVQHFTKNLKRTKISMDEIVEFEDEQDLDDIEESGYKNIHVFSSIKPGTGKSFVSTNVATAIAKYGKKKANGERPRVAIIEADLQNLSVGTLLQIEDSEKNLKTVMERISTIIGSDNTLIGTKDELYKTDEYIQNCFKPFYEVRNLEALVGSQFTMDEVSDVLPSYYVYLVEAIVKKYDVVIIDSNSSLAHTTTYPLLRLANTCHYIVNLDFNNVRNNSKYKETLKDIGVLDKVKYILNEDIDSNCIKGIDVNGSSLEKLIYTADHLNESGFELEARIPEIPKTVFYNRLYEGKPITLDKEDYTLKARYELAKIANEIWELDNMEELKNKVDVLYSSDQAKKKATWFSRK